MKTLPVVFLVLFLLLHVVVGISFDLRPGKEECFYEEAHKGTSINGAFAVTQGSNRDIDVFIYDPRDHQVYSASREGQDKFSIRAELDGTYRLCFSNAMSMMSHKSVQVAITTGDPIDFSRLAKKESMDNVERWIVSISHTVRMIDFHQQEYRMLHDRHLQTVATTNRRVKLWSFIECLAVLLVSAVQVLFIRGIFNRNQGGFKRMV